MTNIFQIKKDLEAKVKALEKENADLKQKLSGNNNGNDSISDSKQENKESTIEPSINKSNKESRLQTIRDFKKQYNNRKI